MERSTNRQRSRKATSVSAGVGTNPKSSGDALIGSEAKPAADSSTSVLTVDVGNTQTDFGLFCDGKLVGRRALTTHQRLTADEAHMQAREVLATFGDGWGKAPWSFSHPEGGILSCVVPSLTDTWAQALTELCSSRPLVVGPGLKTGVHMRYKDPAEIGPDRIADVVAAKATYDIPVILVDFGTTTNIEVVDKDGTFVGGLIAPGLRLGASTLSEAAARLPMIEIRAPRKVIGQTTRAAMQSGVVFGEVARIDGLLDAIAQELGYESRVVLTGNDAATMASLLHHEVSVDMSLTLRGLWLIWVANQR